MVPEPATNVNATRSRDTRTAGPGCSGVQPRPAAPRASHKTPVYLPLRGRPLQVFGMVVTKPARRAAISSPKPRVWLAVVLTNCPVEPGGIVWLAVTKVLPNAVGNGWLGRIGG